MKDGKVFFWIMLLNILMFFGFFNTLEKKYEEIKAEINEAMYDKIDSMECELSVARDSIVMLNSQKEVLLNDTITE